MRRQEAISTKSFELDALTKEKVIRTALKTAFRLGLPIAIWRKPNQSEVNLVISFESALKLNKLDLDQLPKGFFLALLISQIRQPVSLNLTLTFPLILKKRSPIYFRNQITLKRNYLSMSSLNSQISKIHN